MTFSKGFDFSKGYDYFYKTLKIIFLISFNHNYFNLLLFFFLHFRRLHVLCVTPIYPRDANMGPRTTSYSKITLLAVGALTHKICYSALHVIPPINFPQIAVHGWIKYLELWTTGIICCLNSRTLGKHNLLVVEKYTIYPLGENLNPLIVDCILKFKQNWIIVLLFLNIH